MPTYTVRFSLTAVGIVHIEANSPEEAEDLAGDKLDLNLCHHCANIIDALDVEEVLSVDLKDE